jgi:HK97 gp10 family phage protein
MAEIEIRHNLPDFSRQLKAFGYDFERKAIRSGVAAASRIFKNKVVAVLNRPRRSPVRKGETPGTLRRAIYIKRTRAPKGEEHYFVGVRQGKKARGRKGGSADAYYWRWVELGHRIRRPGQAIRGGRRLKALRRARHDQAGGGRVQAYPFLTPAFNAAKQDALNKFNEMVQKRIAQENAKRAA